MLNNFNPYKRFKKLLKKASGQIREIWQNNINNMTPYNKNKIWYEKIFFLKCWSSSGKQLHYDQYFIKNILKCFKIANSHTVTF